MGNPEQLGGGVEHGLEGTGDAAGKRSKETLKLLEASVEHEHGEQRVSAERKSVEQLFSKERGGKEHAKAAMDGAGRPAPRLITHKDRDQSYRQTMGRIQSELPPAEAAFSKVIHNPGIEKASDIIGGTIARPNALLAGAISAFILVTAVYVVARAMGYRVSGFETIFAFILGWMIGMIYDYARKLYKG